MDKWNEMHLFVLAIKHGGFSSAARALNISPSAVSKMISRLEERLSVRLINRTTRTLSLTEAGHSFYQRCNEILQELDDAESELTVFGQRPKGKLKINCSPGFGKHQLLPLLPSFYELYPDLTIELQLTGQSIDLVSEGVDLAIRLGQLTDTSLVARQLGESPRIVCASPDYLKRYGIPQTPDELTEHNCLSLSTNDAFNQWRFRQNGHQHLISAQGNFTTDNVEALYDYACMGGGIVRLAGFMVQDAINREELIPLLSQYETDKQWVHMVYAHRKFLPVKIRVFVDFLLENYNN
jgi:DNA-binding transcriptional LysR family regulator